MTKQLLSGCIFLLFILGAGIIRAEWQVYDCSLLPAEADTAWHEQAGSHDENPDGLSDYLTVIDDPDIPGNKLLQFDESTGAPKEMWYLNWHADPAVGATLVFRAKALEPGTYGRDFDLYIYNGQVRDRFVSNDGNQIKLNKADQSSPMDTGIWHIYRITIVGDLLEVFVDEDPLAYLSAQGEPLEPPASNLFRFGDLGSDTVGSLYDWFAWDVSGAYPPETGTPIPQSLIDTGSMSTDVDQKIISNAPEDFGLLQNYPNPFNPSTRITFSVPKTANTILTVYNSVGQEIDILVNESLSAGIHHTTFDAHEHSAGVYYYQLKSGGNVEIRKMVLMK
ncbi:T9SS type A sorting domain-containing protein [bacterium]|nr:T9SS type A sorting domain-containing protein [bacterium]